jgi:NADPH:quinone reductase-like Zn-dependent oxidoreductase
VRASFGWRHDPRRQPARGFCVSPAELAEAGEFKPVIDRRYPFEQIAEAHRYVNTGRKRGNVIVTLEHDE